MTTDILKPKRGGFLRPFGTTWFIIEFLKGHAPEESPRIDPDVGAPMVDIFDSYKTVLLFKYAEDAVAREEEKAIRRGETASTEEKHQERLKHFLDYIPIKFHRARYASFTRYFDHLKRLGWVEVTGKTEPSEIQEHHPEGPPRVFYRLTEAGWKATPDEMRDPIMTLYPHYTRKMRSAKRRKYLKF
ncbi:hypothetical protein M1N47_03325 [Dehalococcoidia bacterium]|nr:hypothetical protein [Dehalococcoidia bacterium]